MLTSNMLPRLALVLLLYTAPVWAQSEPMVILNGSLRPGILRRVDRGRVDPAQQLPAMSLLLKRTASQQAALQQLLEDQQNPESPDYRRWLTPQQFADRFSPSAEDAARAVRWLESQGFSVGKTAHGRGWIPFSGAAGQVESAFRTELHRYMDGGREHFANSSAPSIPAALAATVMGIDGLDDFAPDPGQPEMTSGSGTHMLAPDDLAIIYDIAALYQAGIDGSGHKVAVVGSTAFDASALADVAAFRSKFNLPPNVPQVVRDTSFPDPGINQNTVGESRLDVEWVGAIARAATVVYVYSNSFVHAVQYAIDNNLAPVVSMSANIGCEGVNSPANVAFYRGLAQQANAQGITWVNSGSDAGPASCDANGATLAVGGLGLRFPASIPEITAVGGTEFNEQGGNYWSATNTASGASALSYIPETVWNDSAALNLLWAGGGGASLYFAKPAWQDAPGVPSDGARDLPDVALAASFSHDGYSVVRGGGAVTTGGTSASAPVFAGILTLLNHYLVSTGQQAQPGLGNINPTLYRLARTNPAVFHDIVTGDNIVPCGKGTPDCPDGVIGFRAGPGFDLASGLGSVDVNQLALKWASAPPTDSAVVLSVSPNPVYQQTADASGNRWVTTVRLSEEAGIATTITGFTINGTPSDVVSAFGGADVPAHGSRTTVVKFADINVPATMVFGSTGVDKSGKTWSQQVSVPFDAAGGMSLAGVANAASYQQTFAPGMLLYVAGNRLSPVVQIADSVPFRTYMGAVSATINGLAAPLYYVSPGQLDIQIPYEIPLGKATLTVSTLGQIAVFPFTVSATAPGIFTAADGALVPFASGARGQTLLLFVTGQGAVQPGIATGAAPGFDTPVAQLPAPTADVSVTIGGVSATTTFAGIPPGLVGVMQVNFQIPEGAPPGPQKVIVTIGGVASAPATLTVQ